MSNDDSPTYEPVRTADSNPLASHPQRRGLSQLARAAKCQPLARKSSSRTNAIRHGIFTGVFLLADESPREFHGLVRSLIRSLQPANELERIQVEKIATLLWRERRLCQAERAEIEKSMSLADAKLDIPETGLQDGTLSGTNRPAVEESCSVENMAQQVLEQQAFLVPRLDAAVRIAGYGRHLGRELNRALSQLERFRAIRMENSKALESHSGERRHCKARD